MDRTDEFFRIIGESTGVDSASRVLKKNVSDYFNGASYNIANLVLSIQKSIEDNRDSFVDKYGAILSKKSSMSEDERAIFVAETNASIASAEQLISELAANVRSGHMRLKGNAIDHSIGVFSCLDHMLSKTKRDFALMRAQRENIKIQTKQIGRTTSTKRTDIKPTRTDPVKQDLDAGFQDKLNLEHQSVVDELLEFHDQLVRTESLAEEIATMQKIYTDMVAEQSEKIRVIRSDVEEAALEYEKGTKELDKAAERSKWRNFWVSMAIYFMAFMLIFKQLREDIKRM